MSLGSSSPCLDPMCWEVCKSVMLWSLRGTACTQACCVMGHSREVPLGATEPITSDCPLHHESQSLHAVLGFLPRAMRFFAISTATPWTTRFGKEIILEAVSPLPGTPQQLPKGISQSVQQAERAVSQFAMGLALPAEPEQCEARGSAALSTR